MDNSDNINYIGINIGSISLKKVIIKNGKISSEIIPLQVQPVELLNKMCEIDSSYFGISGYLGHISDAAAIERALLNQEEQFDAIVSLGGEAFEVYLLQNNKIQTVCAAGKCAAGSGEFLIQQIARLNLSRDEAIERAKKGKSIKLASRCSVHCKSDVTHKLNRKEASIEDILWSIHESMANKIASLLGKSKNPIKKILVIGGLSLNETMILALQKKLVKIEVCVRSDSSYFDALGTALLTKDMPTYTKPHYSINQTFSKLPNLTDFKSLVTIFEEQKAKDQELQGPFILGIDGGSTTTKAVLLDPLDYSILASHYTRTNGDPISATKECINSIINQTGEQQIFTIATTGSAREIIGAYLGTSAVYNEISAHAAGSSHFDTEVDTIFEIGGQDAKYIYLQNGVPVDYAMNAACSAGTGSFLEESAQSDLGISVYDIGDIALQAQSPIEFKADCAAFINSDIRTALQEGCSKENIISGLVISIVNNYLNKVKGRRKIGNRIFLQGGVAKNSAIAYAFAQATGRQIIVPPHPELMGALGVGLMAIEKLHNGEIQPDDRSLVSLQAAEMKVLSNFICRACKNWCDIERYEVAGRKFPFGGRCSKYENTWQKSRKFAQTEDFVAQRNDIIFHDTINRQNKRGIDHPKIGIPRALTTHSLLPLYYTFFNELGLDVTVSGINSEGELKLNAPFCFPAQIAHGAVLDLIENGIDTIFFPQVQRMPFKESIRRSYLCPITQSSPYVIKKAFSNIKILTPVLNFLDGYGESKALIQLAINELGFNERIAKQAYQKAIDKQLIAEKSLYTLGKKAITKALERDTPSIILVGRSYNAFPPETSQLIAKKLSSKGIITIPMDCLGLQKSSKTAWYFSNLIMDAVDLVKQNDNLYLIYVRNFGCNIDAFTHEYLRKEMGTKPYLMLELDSHTADTGTQTRLEAFLEIISNYRKLKQVSTSKPFKPCTFDVSSKTFTSSSGEKLKITDPRVKLHIPIFSYYHYSALQMGFSWLGLHSVKPLDIEKEHLSLGMRYSSGKECLPIPISYGQILTLHKHKKKGEIIGFHIMTNAEPCVVSSFADLLNNFIIDHQLEDFFIFTPSPKNNFYGLPKIKMIRYLSPIFPIADTILEIENALAVVGEDGSINQLRGYWEELIKDSFDKNGFEKNLQQFINQISHIPRVKNPMDCPKVLLTGDYFVRYHPFFFQGIDKLYAKNGIILKPVNMNEMLQFPVYDNLTLSANELKVEPNSAKAMLKAWSRCLNPNGQMYIGTWAMMKYLKKVEKQIRLKFAETGLLFTYGNNLRAIFEYAADHIHTSIFTESVLTIGKTLEARQEGFEGIMLIGPFSCLPFRVSEAILKPIGLKYDFPIISYETDGTTVSPTFLRLVDVHIQQVLRKHGEKISGVTRFVETFHVIS